MEMQGCYLDNMPSRFALDYKQAGAAVINVLNLYFLYTNGGFVCHSVVEYDLSIKIMYSNIFCLYTETQCS